MADTVTRFVDMPSFAASHPEAPVPFDIQSRQLGAVATVSIGGGFGGDIFAFGVAIGIAYQVLSADVAYLPNITTFINSILSGEAQDQATQWLWNYNNERPNMGIGGITPAQKLKMAA